MSESPRRGEAGGRNSRLAHPDFCKQVAAAFVAGATRNEMCELFDVKDPYTITRWRRDSRVKSLMLPMVEDRILQITRKVDSVIEQRLEYSDKMSNKELLAIRKEYLGGALRSQTEAADEEAIGAAQDMIDSDPEAVKDLIKRLDKSNG